jgi:phosphatidylglycerol:prolipoprotein diacylglycerol transferase
MIYYTPHPVLFNIGPFTIYSWGLLNAIAILVISFFIFKNAKKHFKENEILKIFLVMLISGILFARIFYILIHSSEFLGFYDYFMIWKGGLEGFGVMIGGLIGTFIYSKIRKFDFWRFMDISAPWFALGYAIGRIGCFLRGCCFGIPTSLPWGMVWSAGSLPSLYFPNLPLHPTQLYHALADFIIFFILIYMSRKRERQFIRKTGGNIFLLLLVLYSAERFLVDFLRWHSSSQIIAFGFSIEQLVYALIFVISLILIIKRDKRIRT